ncbi:MAG: hypothetical protein MR687_10380, partial [Spirochaetales bacterium]|nr:hypothetical protein [Spirochaetales bacterium]
MFYHNSNQFIHSPIYTCLKTDFLVGVFTNKVVRERFSCFQQIVFILENTSWKRRGFLELLNSFIEVVSVVLFM